MIFSNTSPAEDSHGGINSRWNFPKRCIRTEEHKIAQQWQRVIDVWGRVNEDEK